MQYALQIRDKNQQAHIDIEKDLETCPDGLFTFTLRVSGGNITDYNVMECEDARKYLSLKAVVVQELVISYDPREQSEASPLRPDNGECEG